MHSIKIETVDVQLPTGQFDSPTDTPSIAVANYNCYNTSILLKQSTIELIPYTPTGHVIYLLFVADTEFLLPMILPTGNIDNNSTNSI